MNKKYKRDELETNSDRRLSDHEKKNDLDDMFNLTKAMMKKNKNEPIVSESLTIRENETNRNFLKQQNY